MAHRNGTLPRQLLLHIVGQSLGAFPDRTVIDRIRAEGVHPTATTARAKWNHGPKDVIEYLPLPTIDVFPDGRDIGVIGRIGQPSFEVLLGTDGKLVRGDSLRDQLTVGIEVGHGNSKFQGSTGNNSAEKRLGFPAVVPG